MKTLSKIFILLICILCSSCQKEETVNTDDTSNLETEIFTNNISRSNTGPPNVLEVNLKWAAFMMSYILRNNQDIYTYVNSSLQNEDNVITLNELFENETINFEEAVISWMSIEYFGHPEREDDQPVPRIQGLLDGRNISAFTFADLFIDYLTRQNCIELYFPKSINFSGTYSVTTTGHPINDDNFNDGVEHIFTPNDEPNIRTTTRISVTQSYVDNNNNIIIARPYRVLSGNTSSNCAYTEYSDIDFTDFINGTNFSSNPSSTNTTGQQ